PARLTGQLHAQRLHARTERVIDADVFLDLVDRMDHGRVVAAAERLADLDQRNVEQLAHQVHRDLAWHGQLLRPLLRDQSVDGDAELPGDALADQIRCQLDRAP